MQRSFFPGVTSGARRPPRKDACKDERGTRVYVVCSKFTDIASLRNVFEVHGPVADITLLRDADGKLRGCAFITFLHRVAAETAIKKCNGMHVCGRAMKVMMADRRPPVAASAVARSPQSCSPTMRPSDRTIFHSPPHSLNTTPSEPVPPEYDTTVHSAPRRLLLRESCSLSGTPCTAAMVSRTKTPDRCTTAGQAIPNRIYNQHGGDRQVSALYSPAPFGSGATPPCYCTPSGTESNPLAPPLPRADDQKRTCVESNVSVGASARRNSDSICEQTEGCSRAAPDSVLRSTTGSPTPIVESSLVRLVPHMRNLIPGVVMEPVLSRSEYRGYTVLGSAPKHVCPATLGPAVAAGSPLATSGNARECVFAPHMTWPLPSLSLLSPPQSPTRSF